MVESSLGGASPGRPMPCLRQQQDGRGRSGVSSRHPARLPLTGAELAPVDDAGILVAGGTERDGAAHFSVGDRAFEAVGQVACLITAAKAEANQISLERARDRALELRRFLI